MRSWYSAQVSFSCQGRSQGTHALAPQSWQVQISGARGRRTRTGAVPDALGFFASTAVRTLLLIQPDQELPLASLRSIGFSLEPAVSSSLTLLSCTCPDAHPGARHQRQPGVFSAMYLRSSSTYLEYAVSIVRKISVVEYLETYLANIFFGTAISTSMLFIFSSHCGHWMCGVKTEVSICDSIHCFKQRLHVLMRWSQVTVGL